MTSDCPPFSPHGSLEAYAAYRLGARLIGRPVLRAISLPEPALAPRWTRTPTDAGVRPEILAEAESALHGRVKVFSHEVDIGPMPAWHADPISSHVWPSHHRVRLFPIAGPPGALRRVWELNRMQWLPSLASAYRVTAREEFVIAGWRHILGWIDANPPGCGINWTSPLEMAMRVLSWLSFMVQTRSSPPSDATRFWQSVHAQARATAWHLSLRPRPNNHLAGEALLLVTLGVVCPWMRGAGPWRRLGRNALAWGIGGCLLPDGSPAEGSLNYGAFAKDAYSAAEALLESTGRRLAGRAGTHLAAARRLFGRLPRLATPPQMGDSDEVTLTSLTGPLLRAVTAEGLIARSHDDEDAAATPRELPSQPPENDGNGDTTCDSFALATRGEFTVLCVVGRMGLSPYYGHAHAHALSIQLWLNGEPVFIDPGTYSYAEQPWRDYFRSTAAHCTVEVEGESQARPTSDFAWQAAYSCSATIRSRDDVFELRGSHDGYRRLPQRVGHSRRVHLSRGRLEIEDSLCGRAPFTARLYWHLHPRWEVVRVEGPSVLIAKGSEVLRLTVQGPGRPTVLTACLDPLAGWWSPAFECRAPTTTIRMEARHWSIRWSTEVERAVAP